MRPTPPQSGQGFILLEALTVFQYNIYQNRPMRFSMSTECAIHGLLFLALYGKGKPVLLPGLARRVGVSEHTFRKVFQALAGAGIVVAFRGARGGYVLGRELGKITLRDIVEAVETERPAFQCLLRKKRCDLGAGCAVGSLLARAMEEMGEVLERITVGELLESVRARGKRLRWARV
jgi:Rrf2 family protein